MKRRISEVLGVPLKEIRHAGKKDTAATAVQWLSWPRKDQKSNQPLVNTDQFEILTHTQHEHGLSVGHVKSNSFRLILKGPQGALDAMAAKALFFPNFFGPQRFGSGARIWAPDMRPGVGARPSRDAVSVRQAILFNTYLHQWFSRDEMNLAEDEIWMNAGSKRFFQAALDEDIRERFMMGSLSPSGPVFGYKLPLRHAENAFLASHQMAQEDFRQWGKSAKGSRRPLLVLATDFEYRYAEDAWSLSFRLPAGVYATVFLIHLISPQVLKDPPHLMPNFTQEVSWEKDEHEYRLAMV